MRGRKCMIKVKLTQNYTGFNIEGTFDDLYELYDNIDYFLLIIFLVWKNVKIFLKKI